MAQFNKKFGEVIKGKTTGTIYVLIEGEYRIINVGSVKSCGAIPEYSKKRTIKIYALIDDNLVQYTHSSGNKSALNSYKIAKQIIEGLESDCGTWLPQKKVDESFKVA